MALFLGKNQQKKTNRNGLKNNVYIVLRVHSCKSVKINLMYVLLII